MANFGPLKKKIVELVIAMLIPNIGGWLMFIILDEKIKEHESKEQLEPSYAPPGWVVGIAWTILYTIMGIASWRVWKIGNGFSGKAKIPLLLCITTLLLNWLWPLIAFGLDSLIGAIIEMIILQIFVISTGILYYRIDKISGILFIPYFIYLAFATVVCVHIYILNNF